MTYKNRLEVVSNSCAAHQISKSKIAFINCLQAVANISTQLGRGPNLFSYRKAIDLVFEVFRSVNWELRRGPHYRIAVKQGLRLNRQGKMNSATWVVYEKLNVLSKDQKDILQTCFYTFSTEVNRNTCLRRVSDNLLFMCVRMWSFEPCRI
ncbi:unnamed protein product [Cylicocyclus nassatus]|uniref:Uncharacterized protein n=1 Tax=Cylicocyclus nassatus TaxID=53992 RepID=A0AA36H6T1_CYLNA|nr:unnamed protein product [Cylicocyclus nassatus]